MATAANLPERDSGDGRRTPRIRELVSRLWAEALALNPRCGCGLARVPYRIGRADGLVCPVCDRAPAPA